MKKFEAPMSAMQKKEWIKSVKQVDKKSKKDDEKKKGPLSVRKPPAGKKVNPKAVKDYDKVIAKKLNKDDKKK